MLVKFSSLYRPTISRTFMDNPRDIPAIQTTQEMSETKKMANVNQFGLCKGLGNHYGSHPMLHYNDDDDDDNDDNVKITEEPKKTDTLSVVQFNRSDIKRHSYDPHRAKCKGTKNKEQIRVRKPHFGKEPPLWKSIFNER